jgi:hypothetical protein
MRSQKVALLCSSNPKWVGKKAAKKSGRPCKNVGRDSFLQTAGWDKFDHLWDFFRSGAFHS